MPILQLKYQQPIAKANETKILKKSNFSVVKAQNSSYLIITHRKLEGKYLLNFKTTALITNIIVPNVDNTLVDIKEAGYVLNKMYTSLK